LPTIIQLASYASNLLQDIPVAGPAGAWTDSADAALFRGLHN